jgi:hypothetical protein
MELADRFRAQEQALSPIRGDLSEFDADLVKAFDDTAGE